MAWTTMINHVELQPGRNVITLSALGKQGLVNVDHFALTARNNEGN